MAIPRLGECSQDVGERVAVKRRSTGKYQVDIASTYVGVYSDRKTADLTEQRGKRLIEIGVPLHEVITTLRGGARGQSLDEYAARWLSSRTASAETLAHYQAAYDRLSPVIGKRTLQTLSPADVREAVSHMAAKDYAPKTIHDTINLLRSILADAVDDGLMATSPARRVSNLPPNKRLRVPHALSVAEYDLLVAVAPERWRTMVAIMPRIGLRVSELSGLERRDIHDGRLHVVRQRYRGVTKPYGKTDAARRSIPISPGLQELLDEQMRYCSPQHNLVFGGVEGGWLRYDAIDDLFKALRKASGLDIRPHDMRHTYGSWLLAARVDVATVSVWMGHASPAITYKHYVHQIKEMSEANAAALDRFLASRRGRDGDGDSA